MDAHMKKDDTYFLTLALTQAHTAYSLGEVPIGAVLTVGDEVISSAYNLRELPNDPLGHAELITIRSASQRLKSWRLTGSTLYVTVEPCLMCAGAIGQARISRLVYGCPDKKAGAVESLYQVLEDPRLNHQVEVTRGVLENECRELMQNFFERLR